ncbi:MAG: peptidase D-alanyl-D-alanine carboxypeptidase 1 [Verrucomicrobiaceae bacterium]|nr:peptidase D-alanyl-D-alanine carboxypeptidase 1 [Verrucomicrobiaceae bacterium]
MNTSKTRFLTLVLCTLAFISSAHAGTAPTYHPAVSAGLVKLQNQVLWEQDADERLPQASLTKIMTALLVLEKYQPDAVVTISPEAAAAHPTKIGLHKGDRMRVADLLAATLIHSANDACHALADWHSGNEEKFVERMNERAKQLGLHDTHFANACGFDAEGHYSSAHDLAKLADLALQNKTFSRLVTKQKMVIRTVDGKRKFIFQTTNALIGKYDGAMGVKTGFTFKAGPCLVAISKRNNVRVMIVMLNARNRWPNAREMFDLAFQQAPRLREQRVASRVVSSESKSL